MRQIAVFLALMLLAIPLVPADGDAGGEPGRALPPLPPIFFHQGRIVLDDLSAMQRFNLELRKDDGLELSKGLQYAGLAKVPVTGAAGSQKYPAIGMQSSGNFVVTWHDNRTGGENRDIYAQRFDARGGKLGSEIAVCTQPNAQGFPAVAVDSKGGFIVTWGDVRDPLKDADIYAQRFDSQGNRVGTEIVVLSQWNGQVQPKVAFDSKDRFTVVWNDERNGTLNIYAQRFDAGANKLGGEIIVSPSGNEQVHCAIATDSNDNFLVTWEERIGGLADIFAQRFDSDGNKLGARMLASGAPEDEMFSCIARDSNDRYIVAWVRFGSAGGFDILAQRYDAGGGKIGSELSVGSGLQLKWFWMVSPGIAVDSDDGFTIAWADNRTGSTVMDAFAQRFDSSGAKAGGRITIAAGTPSPSAPDLKFNSKDELIFAWMEEKNGADYDVQVNRFIIPFLSSGTLTTDRLAPANFISWGSVSENATYGNPSANSVTFELSTDNGASWRPVPDNGSLAAADPARAIRIRARLSTTDISTSPVLYGITVTYVFNRVPAVALPADLSCWKRTPVTVPANATDGDLDPLLYEWTQTGGPPAEFNASSPNLSFTPDRSGTYSFRVSVQDWYNQSLPAYINLTVRNRPPVALLTAGLTSVLTGESVLFDASASSGPEDNLTAYNFRFGDGNETGWQPNSTAAHAYASPGSYNASVWVRDEEGNESTSASVMVNVTSPARKADAKEEAFPWWIVILFIAVIIAIVLLVAVARRRRKPTTVILSQPPATARPGAAPAWDQGEVRPSTETSGPDHAASLSAPLPAPPPIELPQPAPKTAAPPAPLPAAGNSTTPAAARPQAAPMSPGPVVPPTKGGDAKNG